MFIINSSARRNPAEGYAAATTDLVRQSDMAFASICQWPGYAKTPLMKLETVAAEVGVGCVLYKDEASRFGLGSFKALGGAYAVYRLVCEVLENKGVEAARITVNDLLQKRYASIIGDLTVTSATAGNHGRSVAWGARMFGCKSVIFIHEGVSDDRAKAIAQYGAEVRRVRGDYDESVRVAASTATEQGWQVVSDTSYPGYTHIPAWVMQGYTVLFGEIDSELSEPPTHVFVQGGVGGLAASVAAWYAVRLGEHRPVTVVVEPDDAACLYQSVRQGQLQSANGGLKTMMLGMACGEPSLLAWNILVETADAVITISDTDAIDAMRTLNRCAPNGQPIVAGECAGAGLAALKRVKAGPELAAELKLTESSRVLLIGTEGATDPAAWEAIMGFALPRPGPHG